MDTNELPGKLRLRLNGCVNPSGLTDKVRVERTHDDAGMLRVRAMQANEVLAVESQHGAIVCTGESQHVVVRDGLPSFASFLNGQHVVPQSAEFLDDRQWEIFVCVQTRHILGRFILSDLLLDLIFVRTNVGPGVG